MTRLRGTDGFDAWRSIIKAPPFSFRQSLPIFFHEEKLPFLPLKVQKKTAWVAANIPTCCQRVWVSLPTKLRVWTAAHQTA